MAILAHRSIDAFFLKAPAVIYERWPVCPDRHGCWRVALSVGNEVMYAVFGDDVYRRPCDSYWVQDDFGNLVKVQ